MILPFRHHLRNTAITAGKLAVLRISFRQVFSGPNRRKSHLTFRNLPPIQICEHPGNVSVDANRLFFDLFWAKRFAQIDTAIHRFRISRRHLPERVLDDARRICPYSQFQKTERELPHGEEGNPHSALRPHTSPHPAQKYYRPADSSS